MRALLTGFLAITAIYAALLGWRLVAHRLGRRSGDDLFVARRLLRLPNWPERRAEQVAAWHYALEERRSRRRSSA